MYARYTPAPLLITQRVGVPLVTRFSWREAQPWHGTAQDSSPAVRAVRGQSSHALTFPIATTQNLPAQCKGFTPQNLYGWHRHSHTILPSEILVVGSRGDGSSGSALVRGLLVCVFFPWCVEDLECPPKGGPTQGWQAAP